MPRANSSLKEATTARRRSGRIQRPPPRRQAVSISAASSLANSSAIDCKPSGKSLPLADDDISWRHPAELEFIYPETLSQIEILHIIQQHAFSVPPPPSDDHDTRYTIITSMDGSTTILPAGYRIPLMFAAKYLWESIRLVLTSKHPSPAEEWASYKFDILNLSRLCTGFLESARIAEKRRKTAGIPPRWRSQMFDRVLTRYFLGWLLNREDYVRAFWKEFKEDEYQKDVIRRDWRKQALKGHYGFYLTREEIDMGITIRQFQCGLIIEEGRVSWNNEAYVRANSVAILAGSMPNASAQNLLNRGYDEEAEEAVSKPRVKQEIVEQAANILKRIKGEPQDFSPLSSLSPARDDDGNEEEDEEANHIQVDLPLGRSVSPLRASEVASNMSHTSISPVSDDGNKKDSNHTVIDEGVTQIVGAKTRSLNLSSEDFSVHGNQRYEPYPQVASRNVADLGRSQLRGSDGNCSSSSSSSYSPLPPRVFLGIGASRDRAPQVLSDEESEHENPHTPVLQYPDELKLRSSPPIIHHLLQDEIPVESIIDLSNEKGTPLSPPYVEENDVERMPSRGKPLPLPRKPSAPQPQPTSETASAVKKPRTSLISQWLKTGTAKTKIEEEVRELSPEVQIVEKSETMGGSVDFKKEVATIDVDLADVFDIEQQERDQDQRVEPDVTMVDVDSAQRHLGDNVTVRKVMALMPDILYTLQGILDSANNEGSSSKGKEKARNSKVDCIQQALAHSALSFTKSSNLHSGLIVSSLVERVDVLEIEVKEGKTERESLKSEITDLRKDMMDLRRKVVDLRRDDKGTSVSCHMTSIKDITEIQSFPHLDIPPLRPANFYTNRGPPSLPVDTSTNFAPNAPSTPKSRNYSVQYLQRSISPSDMDDEMPLPVRSQRKHHMMAFNPHPRTPPAI